MLCFECKQLLTVKMKVQSHWVCPMCYKKMLIDRGKNNVGLFESSIVGIPVIETDLVPPDMLYVTTSVTTNIK
jgi:hypothetical protein